MSFSFLSLVKYVQYSLKISSNWLIIFQLRMETVLRVSQTILKWTWQDLGRFWQDLLKIC